MWESRYLNLSKRIRRFINNFMSSKSGNDFYDNINWHADLKSYGFKLHDSFAVIKEMWIANGPLPEDVE